MPQELNDLFVEKKCFICKQSKEKKTHYSVFVNGKKVEGYACEDCSKNKEPKWSYLVRAVLLGFFVASLVTLFNDKVPKGDFRLFLFANCLFWPIFWISFEVILSSFFMNAPKRLLYQLGSGKLGAETKKAKVFIFGYFLLMLCAFVVRSFQIYNDTVFMFFSLATVALALLLMNSWIKVTQRQVSVFLKVAAPFYFLAPFVFNFFSVRGLFTFKVYFLVFFSVISLIQSSILSMPIIFVINLLTSSKRYQGGAVWIKHNDKASIDLEIKGDKVIDKITSLLPFVTISQMLIYIAVWILNTIAVF